MEKGIGTFLSSMCFMSAAAAGSFLKLPGEAQHLHSFSAALCYHRNLEEHCPGRANCPMCCQQTKSNTCWLHAKKGNGEGNIFNTSLLARLGIMRHQQIKIIMIIKNTTVSLVCLIQKLPLGFSSIYNPKHPKQKFQTSFFFPQLNYVYRCTFHTTSSFHMQQTTPIPGSFVSIPLQDSTIN